jgi:hypothetical protein
LDVQTRKVVCRVGLLLILALALALRLKGIHNPILDHPGWRQGDTASIAKNFATLQYNILYPQTNYNGPPPNYVELELQIVPIIAATFYKIFGIHEIFGRLTTIAFSLGTVAVLAFFARWLFASEIAGIAAAFFYAVMPGSLFYGRTFTPDTTMVFFMTAALYAITRMLVEEEHWTARSIGRSTILLALAFLAKPVSLAALVPVLSLTVERARAGRTFNWSAVAIVIALPLIILYGYDRAVASHAEWHWASGITRLHVLPALKASLTNAGALHVKLTEFRQMLGVMSYTMIGPAITALGILGFFFLPQVTKSRTLLWAWLIGGLAYIYVVVTVERVDYYMYLLLPLAALTAAGFTTRLIAAVSGASVTRIIKYAAAMLGVIACAGIVYQDRQIVRPYYNYNKQVYRYAIALSATLAPNALIVMGHYDPSVLYYIGRYGWEEDPYLWTPFDEQSAIRKGARYFVAIEKNRFYRNVELCAWMQRFPVMNPNAQWPVYQTDPALVKPGAEQQWRAFRNAEKAGNARAWLDAHGLCR